MFTFHRRAGLEQRLLRARAGDGDDADAETEALVKALADAGVRGLHRAVTSGGLHGGCVPVPASLAPLAARVAVCRGWRWPDVRSPGELRPLPHCAAFGCCNPYHYSRHCKPESPPPPYCRFDMDDKLKPEDRAPSEDSRRTDHERLQPGSLTTDGEGKLGEGSREWCRLAYWELAARVGRQYPVEDRALNVFSGPLRGDGLCLETLAQGATTSPDNVVKTRAKIGQGVTLSREADGVWVYNRSEQPIFVNSPTLDDTETRSLLVYRVPPGHCLCIFDPIKASERPPSPMTTYNSLPTGPIDPNSVRISFAKGWGPKYSRQDVTGCPCWLEVLLAPCR